MYKIYLDKIDYVSHKDNIRDILDMLICDTRDNNYDLYEYVEGELYEMVYGKKISEEIANKWVETMQPVGEYWRMEETASAMHNLGYHYDPVDFYVVANMCFNDYYDLVKDDEDLALHLANNWLNDEDARDCKLYQYWKHVIKR